MFPVHSAMGKIEQLVKRTFGHIIFYRKYLYFPARYFIIKQTFVTKTNVYLAGKGGVEMNEKERLILKLIQDDPFITQNELAEKLNLSRPAVANYISSLMKRGEIIGRAYVLREQESVVCIGGANVDRKIMLKGPLQFNTSNPVTSYKAVGGVARNISENLGRLGVKTTLLTALGDDVDGKWLVENSKQWMDLSFPSHILRRIREIIWQFSMKMVRCRSVLPIWIYAI